MRDYFAAASKEENVIYEIDQALYKENSIFRPIRLVCLETPRYKLVVLGLHILIDTLILIALWSDSIWVSVRQ
ncbi:hypothetical protein B4U84_16090 [Westiellopsis prolifica IICB1]|nr:hypothetical protein B4U84_16090 [Westiellopsis prolifica IICB1]